MTGNHQLLYRVAELMLEHEQHILSVDLLFDDEQIGDSVKSIQIDSPYQQMLFEGVLTESVREEKLFVSFTVEGYFHYVLGEVIYHRTDGLDAEALKQIVEENRLNGAKEGVEQCLIREVSNHQYRRLFQLIDLGGEISKCCSVPFAFGILSAFNNQKVNRAVEYQYSIDFLINWLISDSTESDYDVLFMAIRHLEMAQKNDCLLELFNTIVALKQYSSISYIKTLVKGLPFFEQDIKYQLLEEIESFLETHKEHSDYPEIIFELATKWLMCAEYDRAIDMFKKSMSFFNTNLELHQEQIEKIYSNLGAAYWYKGDLNSTQHYFELSYSKCLDIFGSQHSSTSGSLQNLALVNVLQEDFEESIVIFKRALDISLKSEGYNHPNTARILSNLGSANLRLKNLDMASELFEKVLSIDKAVLYPKHPSLALDYEDLGDVFAENGNLQGAVENYELSRSIFIDNYGLNFPHVSLLDDKINDFMTKLEDSK
jgi:tetratricopeptide (TPR) repeat protein